MKKFLYIVALIATIAHSEQSAFIAESDLDTNLILKSQFNELSQRVEGLQSTLEGINLQYSKSNTRLFTLEELINNFNQELNKLKIIVEDNIKAQNLYNDELKALVLELNNQKNLSKQNPADVLSSAILDFETKNFDDAKEKFIFLIDKNYKPARANFYLGEIYYNKEEYQNAIKHYKISSNLYNKADYMLILLYHTGVSLQKLGDINNANNFFKALEDNYPKEAKTLKELSQGN